MGIVNKIKEDVRKSGQSKGKFLFFRDGQKTRIRFLEDMEMGYEFVFHDSYSDGVNVPCQEIFDRDCDFCKQEGLRTRTFYAWSVYDYEANEVRVFMFPVNDCSPLQSVVSFFDSYGTITDRDYVIQASGSQIKKRHIVVPQDKSRFKNEKAKPFSLKALKSMVDKAWPCGDVVDDEVDDDFEIDVKVDDKKNKSQKRANGAKKTSKEEVINDPDFPDDVDYDSMSAKELYKLCIKNGIDVEPRLDKEDYIEELKLNDGDDEW